MLRQVGTQGYAADNRKSRRQKAKSQRKVGGNQQKNAMVPLHAAEEMRRAGRVDEAETICRQAVDEFPDDYQVYLGMGVVLEVRERSLEAYDFYKKAVVIAPHVFAVWHQFGLCLFRLQQFEAAAIALQKAAVLDPRNDLVHTMLGHALASSGKVEEALQAFEKVIELKPDVAEGYASKGVQLQALGQFDAAKEYLNRAIALDPDLAVAHFRLAGMKQTGEEALETLSRLRELADSPDCLPLDRASALFAASRILQKQNREDEAFAHCSEANHLLHGECSFERKVFAQQIDNTIASFTPDAISVLKDAGSSSRTPIFVIGMPRSGTTLVESIIASHPDVQAGGE